VGARDRIQMQVKSFTYERSWYGTYHRQRFFSLETMDTHVRKMLSRGWHVLTQVAHSGQGRGLDPFAKRDTITIAFRKTLTRRDEEAQVPNNSDQQTAAERSRQTNLSKKPDCLRGSYRPAFLSLPPQRNPCIDSR
jgi:hypothetical protein